MKPCPTCGAMIEDHCMCGKCPNCDPEHFKPQPQPVNVEPDAITEVLQQMI